MAMLAGPKRRQNLVLQPRGKPLYNDTSSFGSKMLAKMGWEPGKGLGAKEDGNLEFIKIKYKKDAEGIGFEMRDDQWTEHENGFNQLLTQLSSANKSTENSGDEATPSFAANDSKFGGFSGESLEKKSKTSRARVHYKKFTRGKDLTQYSKKDLANIFGKRVDEEEPQDAIKESESEEEVVPKFKSSVTTTISQLSSSDYFKQKMDKRKNNGFTTGDASDESPKISEENIEENCEVPEHNERKKSCKKKKQKKEAIEDEQPAEQMITENDMDEAPVKKKKKKSKHSNEDLQNTVTDSNVEDIVIEISGEVIEEEPKVKKSKKDKKSKKRIAQETPEGTADKPVEPTKNKQAIENETNIEDIPTTTSPAMNDIDLSKPKIPYAELERAFNKERNEQISKILFANQSLLARTDLKFHPYKVEILKNADIKKFKNSNLAQIVGYGLTADSGLDIIPGTGVLDKLLHETITTPYNIRK